MTDKDKSPRFMYHSFPRRGSGDKQEHDKALSILKLVVQHGLLLTPEVTHWRDSKVVGPAEDYTVVARRCCFTELEPAELHKHAEYFGPYALEFEHRTLCDFGAMPVIYIPRMSGFEDYGIGPAFVTQLAHIQDVLDRLVAFKQFGNTGAATNPLANVFEMGTLTGDIVMVVDGTPLRLTIPKEIIDRAQRVNANFTPPQIPPGQAVPVGLNAGGFSNLMNTLMWGLHQPDVLAGMVKAMASLIYPTERKQDPLLSYYQQREWRIIGGMLHDGKRSSFPPSAELRRHLLDLDPKFFGRELFLPKSRNLLVDECEVFQKKSTGEHVLTLAKRVICPKEQIDEVKQVLRSLPLLEVVSLESISN